MMGSLAQNVERLYCVSLRNVSGESLLILKKQKHYCMGFSSLSTNAVAVIRYKHDFCRPALGLRIGYHHQMLVPFALEKLCSRNINICGVQAVILQNI